MRINPNNTSLWIINYMRRAECAATVQQWLNSFPFEEVNILAAHSSMDITAFPEEIRDKIKIKYDVTLDWMLGSYSRCANIAMMHAFDKKEWCLISQDDVLVTPGWDKIINDTTHDYYVAPAGNVVQLLNKRCLEDIGWFDERYRAIGGEDFDYQLRYINQYPQNVSIHDEHAWNLRYNDVGLANHWHMQAKNDHLWATRNRNHDFVRNESWDVFVAKWGMDPDPFFAAGRIGCAPNLVEVDWHPSFTHYSLKTGRLSKSPYRKQRNYLTGQEL